MSSDPAISARGVAALLTRAIEEHERLILEQKSEFDRKLSEEKARHERDLATVKAELALHRPSQPPGLEKLELADSETEQSLELALGSSRGDERRSTEKRSSSHDGPLLRVPEAGPRKSPSRKASASKSLSRLRGAEEPKGRLRRFVDGPLDYLVSVLIALNTLLLFVQLQLNGQRIGVEEGLTSGDKMTEGARLALFVAEWIFNLCFFVELLTRMAVLRRNFFFHRGDGGFEYLNAFDTLVVLGTSLDLILQTQNADSGLMNFGIFRLLRFLRLVRVLRAVSSVRILLKLRVLLSTVACSLLALFWSIVLLFFTLLMAALFLNQALSGALSDEQIDLQTRQWLFRMYGTSARSFYTVFELTFSGGWPNYARPLVEDISPWWSLFFYVYIVIVVFAMFRIITTLFLRDTLALAANDAETAIQEKMLMQKGIADKLMAFFEQADTSGDGMLTLDEFEAMLDDPMVAAWLSLLELEIRDAMDVFDLVKQDGNMVSSSDFVTGMMRIKGNARSQDVLAILQHEKKVCKDIDSLGASLLNIEQSVRKLAWEARL